MSSRSHSRMPWAAPAVALIAMFSAGAMPHLFSDTDSAAPDLPPLSPTELLAMARTAQLPGLSGTLSVDAELGIAAVPAMIGDGQPVDPMTPLAAGPHRVSVWALGSDKLRLASAAPRVMSNWVRNGDELWHYDPATRTARHYTLDRSIDETSTLAGPAADLPSQLARTLLDEMGPDNSEMSVEPPTYVAARPVYELALAPTDPASGVGRVTIAIDAASGVPLGVEVTDRATGAVTFDCRFTRIDVTSPPTSTFDFTPPPGATVVEASTLHQFMTDGQPRD